MLYYEIVKRKKKPPLVDQTAGAECKRHRRCLLRAKLLLDFGDDAVDDFDFRIPRMRLRVVRPLDARPPGEVGLGLGVAEHIVGLEHADFLASGHGVFELLFGFEVDVGIHIVIPSLRVFLWLSRDYFALIPHDF